MIINNKEKNGIEPEEVENGEFDWRRHRGEIRKNR
jgi:hypothetical protein